MREATGRTDCLLAITTAVIDFLPAFRHIQWSAMCINFRYTSLTRLIDILNTNRIEGAKELYVMKETIAN